MTVEGSAVTAGTFRSLMAGFPSGVTVVTAIGADGLPRGMTCTSLCSVALDPPTLLVSLRTGGTAAAVLYAGRFAVNLLHEGARTTAGVFAREVPRRFDRISWLAGDSGPHLVNDAHLVADCVVVGDDWVGDHVVVFGEVRSVRALEDRLPLLYGLREYARWSQAARSAWQDE